MIKHTVSVSLLVVLLCTFFVTSEEIPARDELGDSLDIPNDQMIVHKRPAFFIGSRYGRSSDGSHNKRLAQRNDRFFFGSRYGKRSKDDGPFVIGDEEEVLSCVYTGVLDLFECKRI